MSAEPDAGESYDRADQKNHAMGASRTVYATSDRTGDGRDDRRSSGKSEVENSFSDFGANVVRNAIRRIRALIPCCHSRLSSISGRASLNGGIRSRQQLGVLVYIWHVGITNQHRLGRFPRRTSLQRQQFFRACHAHVLILFGGRKRLLSFAA